MLQRDVHLVPRHSRCVLWALFGAVCLLILARPAASAQMLAPDQATLDANKAVVMQFNAAISAHDLSALDAIVSADVVDHNPGPGQQPGLDGLKQGLSAFITGFPDVQLTVESIVAEGDMVADRVLSTGTNTGSLFGMPPTGQAVSVEGYDFYRIAHGQIVEIWHLDDMFSELIQLGVIPPPGQ